MSEFMEKVVSILTTVGGKIILALVVFIVGRIIINALSKGLDKVKSFTKLDKTVQGFVHSIVRIGLNLLLVIAIIQVLGIPMTEKAATSVYLFVLIATLIAGIFGL